MIEKFRKSLKDHGSWICSPLAPPRRGVAVGASWSSGLMRFVLTDGALRSRAILGVPTLWTRELGDWRPFMGHNAKSNNDTSQMFISIFFANLRI